MATILPKKADYEIPTATDDDHHIALAADPSINQFPQGSSYGNVRGGVGGGVAGDVGAGGIDGRVDGGVAGRRRRRVVAGRSEETRRGHHQGSLAHGGSVHEVSPTRECVARDDVVDGEASACGIPSCLGHPAHETGGGLP